MRALTYEEWSKEGRGVRKGAVPFHWIDGKPLFSEEDTYNLEKNVLASAANIVRKYFPSHPVF